MSLITFCVLLFSAIVVCSLAAPVAEPEQTAFENKSNISTEDSHLNDLERKLNAIEEKVTGLNQLISHYYSELMENVYQVTGPRFFSKWKSFPKEHIYISNIDTFTVQGSVGQTQYMIQTNQRDRNVSVYEITREGLGHSENITIPGAKTTKNININGTVYIAVACNNDEINDDPKTDSQLYAWTNNKTLELVQTFNNRADDITFGTTTGEIFLTLTTSNGLNGDSTELASKVYKWNPEHRQFNFIQSLQTIHGVKPNFFNTKDHLWLSIACRRNTSFIYRWNVSRFEVFQTIPSPHKTTMDLHPVNVETHLFLVAANSEGPLIVYKKSEFTERFEIFQSISTSKVEALDSFVINNEYFIAVASQRPSTVIIYKFSGATYNFFQEITMDYDDSDDYDVRSDVRSVKVFRADVLSGSWLMGIDNVGSVDLYKWSYDSK